MARVHFTQRREIVCYEILKSSPSGHLESNSSAVLPKLPPECSGSLLIYHPGTGLLTQSKREEKHRFSTA